MLDKPCSYSPHAGAQAIDASKGYRIHILTGVNPMQKFNEAAGVYDRDSYGRFRLRDDDLRDRQIVRAHSVDDIIELMETGDIDRIIKSRIVFNNRAVKWDEFLLYLERPERYVALVDRARHRPKNEYAQPVLMEFVVEKSPRSRYFPPSFAFNAKPIDIGRADREGRKEYLVPGLHVEHNYNTYMEDMFSQTGRYFVLGMARVTTRAYDYAVNHYCDIKITDLRQVYFGNILDIAQTAKRNAEKRAEAPGQIPSSP